MYFKRFNLLLVMALLSLNLKIHAQKTDLGSSRDFIARIKSMTPNNSYNLPIGKDNYLQVKKDFTSKTEDFEVIIGQVYNVGKATFMLRYSATELYGRIILSERRLAYEYITENGQLTVSNVDIDKVLCVDYDKEKKSNTNMNARTSAVSAIPPANDPVYTLESYPVPGAAVVKLDFDGEYVTGTSWNSEKNNGNPIDAVAANFTAEEIKDIWELVSEDYKPFTLNITTSEAVYQAAPVNRRIKCIFTQTYTAGPGTAGIAYPDAFNLGIEGYKPCWSFGSVPRSAANTASHEIGHTLGLHHADAWNDTHTGLYEYYGGHGDWGPIMGNGNKYITQFSKGEYASAKNKEDDLDIISTKNGFSYRSDEDLNTIASARTLKLTNSGNVLSSSNNGIITSSSDVDYFKFTLSTFNSVDIKVAATTNHPNLNVKAYILNASGEVVYTSDPTGMSPAPLSINLLPGDYYIGVDGVGEGTSPTTGYSDYGSIGYYSLSGTIRSCGNDYEANESIAAAKGIVPNSSLDGAITTPTDNDYYKINVTSQMDIGLTLSNNSSGCDLELYDPNGILVAESNNLGPVNEEIMYLATLSGTYYIRVFGQQGAMSTTCYKLFNTIGSNPCPAVNEPNDDFNNATTLDFNTSIQGAVSNATDIDIYKQVFKVPGTIKIKLTNLVTDLDLEFCDQNGQVLKYSSRGSTSDESITCTITSPGTYFIRVFGYIGANSRRCYTLSNSAVFPCSNAYEPNNDLTAPFRLPSFNNTLSADLSSSSDQDCYSVFLPEKGVFIIKLTDLPNAAVIQFYYMDDISGYKFIISNEINSALDKTLECSIPIKGNYVIKIKSFPNIIPTANCYTLNTYFVPVSMCVPFEPNETLTTSLWAPINNSLSSNHISASDVDYYRFDLTGDYIYNTGGKLTFKLIQSYPISMVVYNTSGVEMARAETTHLGTQTLNLSITQPGFYTVALRPMEGSIIGTCYTLSNTYQPNLFPNGIACNSNNRIVEIPANTKTCFDASKDFEFETIVKLDQLDVATTGNEYIINNVPSSTDLNRYFKLFITRNTTLTGNDLITLDAGDFKFSCAKNLKDNKCHQIAIRSFRTNNIRFCEMLIDGVSYPLTSGSQQSISNYGIGNIQSSWILGASFKGIIKEFRVWGSRQSTDVQKTMNYSLVGNEPGLISHYPMLSSQGNSLIDRAPNPVNGELAWYGNSSNNPLVTNTCTSINTRSESVDEYVGNNNMDNNFSVFPNPFTQEVNIVLPNDGVFGIQVLDVLGSVLYKANEVSGIYTINAALPSGIYIVKISSLGYDKIVTIVKQ